MVITSNAGNVEIDDEMLKFKDFQIQKDCIDSIKVGKYVTANSNFLNILDYNSKNTLSQYVAVLYENDEGYIDKIIIPYNNEDDARSAYSQLNQWFHHGIKLEDEYNFNFNPILFLFLLPICLILLSLILDTLYKVL